MTNSSKSDDKHEEKKNKKEGKSEKEEDKSEKKVSTINPLINCLCGHYLKPRAICGFGLEFAKFEFHCELTKDCKNKALYLNDCCNHFYCKECIVELLKKSDNPIKCPALLRNDETCDAYITPTIFTDADFYSSFKIYGNCSLKTPQCVCLAEYVNTCGHIYCRKCLEVNLNEGKQCTSLKLYNGEYTICENPMDNDELKKQIKGIKLNKN